MLAITGKNFRYVECRRNNREKLNKSAPYNSRDSLKSIAYKGKDDESIVPSKCALDPDSNIHAHSHNY